MLLVFGLLLQVGLCTSVWAQNDTLKGQTGEVPIESQRIPSELPQLSEPGQRWSLSPNRSQRSLGQAAELLKQAPGVFVRDYGGLGGLKTVSLRGMGAAHTQVYVEGIPLNESLGNTADLGQYSILGLQKISLRALPGLGSARQYLEGAGVMLTYQDPLLATPQAELGLQGGSFGHQSAWLSGAGKYKGWAWQGLGSSTRSQGGYPFRIENGTQTETHTRQNNPYQDWRAEAGLAKAWGNWRWKIRTQAQDVDRGLPGPLIWYNPISQERLREQSALVLSTLSRQGEERRHQSQYGFRYQHQAIRYQNPLYGGRGGLNHLYEIHQGYVSLSEEVKLWRGLGAFVSADGELQYLSSNRREASQAQRLSIPWATGLSWQYAGLQVRAFASGLWVKQEAVASLPARQNWRGGGASLVYRLGTPGKVWEPAEFSLSYRDFLRQPGFQEIYFQTVANPRLRAETGSQAQADYAQSLRHRGWKLQWRLSGYRAFIRDRIVSVPTQNLFAWSMQNIGRVELYGGEASLAAEYRHTRWGVLGNVSSSWQHSLDRSDSRLPSYGRQIPYTPQELGSARLALRYYLKADMPFEAGAQMLRSSHRYLRATEQDRYFLPGYTQWDVWLGISRVSLWGPAQADLRLDCFNLGDMAYQVVEGYPLPGRHYRVTLFLHI